MFFFHSFGRENRIETDQADANEEWVLFTLVVVVAVFTVAARAPDCFKIDFSLGNLISFSRYGGDHD